MTPIEQQALALVNEIYREKVDVAQGWFQRTLENKYGEALCRAIERHEAFKREVSDAVFNYFQTETEEAHHHLCSFIVPKPVDPVREIMDMIRNMADDSDIEDRIRKALAARNLEITEKKP